MAKIPDSFYFDNFVQCIECSCKAARMLGDTMHHFHVDELKKKMDEIHEFEHAGDLKKHEMLNTLVKAFITPIEREDLLLLSQSIDEVTDKLEDVLIRLYCNNVTHIRPDALSLVDVIIKCCDAVHDMLNDFSNYKKSKTLRDHIIRINTLEEDADRRFIESLRNLHCTCSDPIEIIVWREIYKYLEDCADACEHVADAVESVLMKNA